MVDGQRADGRCISGGLDEWTEGSQRGLEGQAVCFVVWDLLDHYPLSKSLTGSMICSFTESRYKFNGVKQYLMNSRRLIRQLYIMMKTE